ncbi:unnamed protein product [Euphydryas editha]|uniref:Uncharacterized protein n=1 Tax=Euphydryas editha TaxID=104508 RepID=A0AAU9TFI8_EUPED|nr:unnamed protein product [Euphydryas editha]
MSDQLTIYYQNVRGIRTKLHDVYKNVLTCNYQVIVFTETWLNDNIFTAEILDDRYQGILTLVELNGFNKCLSLMLCLKLLVVVSVQL